MKQSFYNSIINIGDRKFLFNALSLKFFIIPQEIESVLMALLKNPDLSCDQLEPIKKLLTAEQFIIPNNYNEYKVVQERILKGSNIQHYSLMLLPTYRCNLSCWYCVQKHEDITMNSELVWAIKRHIENYLKSNDIKTFEIHWFGGEPMLCFETHINEISKYAIQLCDNFGITFYNNITTNGSLLGIDEIMLMKKLRFMQFQITLDGSKRTHNKTRNQQGLPTFDIIVNQIKNIINIIPDAQVFLRYNFTSKNYIEIDELISQLNTIIDKDIRKHIKIAPVKVWQENRRELPEDCFEQIYRKFKTAGYGLADADMCHDYTKCIADMVHSYVIFPNGNVDKCNNITPQEARFKLCDNGIIKPIDPKPTNPIKDPAPEFCILCKSYPACLGPCWIQKTKLDKKGNCVQCTDSTSNISIKERIKNYCLLKLIESGNL